jgi:hypothetical protein
MTKLIFIFIFILLHSLSYGYESEEKLKAVIIGKVAKYITWSDSKRDSFKITVLNRDESSLFGKTFSNQKIKNRDVEIEYVEDISKISQTDILYINKENSNNLEKILESIKDKKIFLVSDIKGFAQKGGMMQIYFVSQKPKLRINLDNVTDKEFKIKSSLLRIADVVREEK